jgi:hypothetical protein
MASKRGGMLRFFGGLAVILYGIMGIGGTWGNVVALLGIVPLISGLFDFCLFAPLFGCPTSGMKVRAHK